MRKLTIRPRVYPLELSGWEERAKRALKGSKIYFATDKKPYKVIATDGRFAICIKPFNLQKTYMYTIVDFKDNMRGPDNYYCKHDYDTDNGCNEALFDLNNNWPDTNTPLMELSARQRVRLDIVKIVN